MVFQSVFVRSRSETMYSRVLLFCIPHILVIISIFLIEPCSSKNVVRVAFAAQGKASEVAEWFTMVNSMKYQSNVTLFLLSFDFPISTSVCEEESVVCIFNPLSTWTSGRNELGRSIAHHSAKQNIHFKYLLMGDADMVKLTHCGDPDTFCKASDYPPMSTKLAACCFDLAMETLLAPEVQWAVISFVSFADWRQNDWLSFAHWDCNDAALTAIHHAAIPVFLPYVELMDKLSWWEAQAILFHAIAGCVPGYSVYSNIFSLKGLTSGHSKYPQGHFFDKEAQAIHQVYGKLGLIPHPISLSKVDLNTPYCAQLDYHKLGLQYPFEDYIPVKDGKQLKTLWNSEAWRNTTQFKKCLDNLRPRYLKYVETGNLTALDGESYN